jgi:hypothetical protein
LRLAARDLELAREPECRHAVHEAEVDRFGGTPLVVRDGLARDIEDLGRGRAVYVELVAKRLEQPFIGR